ncbi:unnamed protein product [Wuchereria bancrofti]|uniref:Uncharacterized protein n=1 Tax=Wuchereria bancrofti TaxID=6293 RepID=A0A3P7DWS4_WUCBA|nr:unnamed protein product [Wuchereria bancrofti]
MWKFLTIVLLMQIAFSCVSTSGIMYAKDPIFTMHLSPPIQWTYHDEEEAHDNPITELEGTEDIAKDMEIEP